MRHKGIFIAVVVLLAATAAFVSLRRLERRFVSEYDGRRTVHHEWFGIVLSSDHAAPDLQVSRDLRRLLQNASLKLPRHFVVLGEPIRQYDDAGANYYLRGRFLGRASDVVTDFARQVVHSRRSSGAEYDRVSGVTRDGQHELEFCTQTSGGSPVATLNIWNRR